LAGGFATSQHIIRPYPVPALIYPSLEDRTAHLAELRAWFLMHAVSGKRQSGHNGNQNGLENDAGDLTFCDPAALLELKLPEPARTDSAAVAWYLASLLYPAEGRGNLERLLVEAETFLNSDEDGNDSPFADLDPASDAYGMRVRSAAGFLMASPRFQEQ
jgi:hypothetical protein